MALITKPNTFSAGATIVASEHNDNFNTIYNDYNGNITNANASASAAFDVSKIDFATMDSDISATRANTTTTAFSLSGTSTTTGSMWTVTDNSSDTGTRKIVEFVGENSAATGATVLTVRQDSTKRAVFIDQNADGESLRIDSEATTATMVVLDNTTLTTGISINVANLDALTTGKGISISSNSSDTGTRDLLAVHNNHASATGATVVGLTQDSTGPGMDVNCTGNGPHLRFIGDPTVASPTDGDMWYTGSALNFRDGSTTVDLLTGLSALSTVDSESNTLIGSVTAGTGHSYLAQTDGFVTYTAILASAEEVTAYVDTDDNPVSGGTIVGKIEGGTADQALSFSVASGEYFEIITSDTSALPLEEVITWRSIGTLASPIDQD